MSTKAEEQKLVFNDIVDSYVYLGENRPYVILIEGPDKTGKTTTALALKEKLEEYGNEVKYVKYPTKRFYNTLVNKSGLTRLERALLFLIDCCSISSDISGKEDVIILDRHPIFSIGAYIVDSLSEQERIILLNAISALFDVMLLPNITFIFRNSVFSPDNSFAANVVNSSLVFDNYSKMVLDEKRETALADYYAQKCSFRNGENEEVLQRLKTVKLGHEFLVIPGDISGTVNSLIQRIIHTESR